MECVRLPIKDSEKILYIGLGLFSKKEDLETFMNNYNLVDGRAYVWPSEDNFQELTLFF